MHTLFFINKYFLFSRKRSELYNEYSGLIKKPKPNKEYENVKPLTIDEVKDNDAAYFTMMSIYNNYKDLEKIDKDGVDEIKEQLIEFNLSLIKKIRSKKKSILNNK